MSDSYILRIYRRRNPKKRVRYHVLPTPPHRSTSIFPVYRMRLHLASSAIAEEVSRRYYVEVGARRRPLNSFILVYLLYYTVES